MMIGKQQVRPHATDPLDEHVTDSAPEGLFDRLRAVAAGCEITITGSARGSAAFASNTNTNAEQIRGTIHPITRSRHSGGMQRLELIGLRVMMQCAVRSNGRMVIAELRVYSRVTRWLNRRAGLRQLESPAALVHLEIWCSDRHWAASVLGDPVIVALVGSLIPPRSTMRHSALHWHPDHLLFAPSADADHILRRFVDWQQQLRALSHLAGSQTQPVKAYSPHWLETHSQFLLPMLFVGTLLFLALLIPLGLALIFLLTCLKIF